MKNMKNMKKVFFNIPLPIKSLFSKHKFVKNHNFTMVKRKTQKELLEEILKELKKPKNPNGLVISIIITFLIIILSLFCILPYLYENWYLKNDKEIVEIEFTQNVKYANSLTIESYPLNNMISNIGTKYIYRFDNIYPLNNQQESVLSFYIKKRLPESNSISCLIEFKNGTKDEFKCSPPNNTNGLYSPINVEYNLPMDGSNITLEYKCSKCNPGAFELQIGEFDNAQKINIFDYVLNVHIDGYSIENIHEENTKTSDTYHEGSIIHFEGDKTTFKSGRINTISYRIMARKSLFEIFYWLDISIMAGIVLYWVERIFKKWG